MFRLMSLASYGQSSLNVLVLVESPLRLFHCERLFQLPWQSATINFPQGKFSLNSNFSSAVFLVLNLACSTFIDKESNL